MQTRQNSGWGETLKVKLAAISLIAMCSGGIYFTIASVPLMSVISLIHHGNIIYYYRMSFAAVGSIPFYAYFAFIALRGLFYPGIRPREKTTIIDRYSIPFCVIVLGVSLIISFLVPFWLLFAGYGSCPQKDLGSYYVTNIELCKTIVRP